MAIVRCNTCGHKAVVGCMPTATCGVLVIAGLGVGAAIAGGFAAPLLLREVAGWLRTPCLIGIFILGGIGGLFAMHYIPWTIEWLIAKCNRCPECGNRDWSFPYTEGFGL